MAAELTALWSGEPFVVVACVTAGSVFGTSGHEPSWSRRLSSVLAEEAALSTLTGCSSPVSSRGAFLSTLEADVSTESDAGPVGSRVSILEATSFSTVGASEGLGSRAAVVGSSCVVAVCRGAIGAEASGTLT